MKFIVKMEGFFRCKFYKVCDVIVMFDVGLVWIESIIVCYVLDCRNWMKKWKVEV